jgi:hypothetical protein
MAELAARDSRIAVRRARLAARLLAANSAKKDREFFSSVIVSVDVLVLREASQVCW